MNERIKEDRNAGGRSYFCSLQRFSIPDQDVFLSTPALQPYLRCAQGTVSGGFLRDLVCCILFEKKLQFGRMSHLQKQGQFLRPKSFWGYIRKRFGYENISHHDAPIQEHYAVQRAIKCVVQKERRVLRMFYDFRKNYDSDERGFQRDEMTSAAF